MPWILAFVFFLSGAAGLVYEVAWVRMLGNSLGASSYVIGTALAAFMGGLALGARLVGKRADASGSPLRVYAKLELGIAACAIVVPFAFELLPLASRAIYPVLEGKLTALTIFRCLLAFVVMLVPTALMGATFPAMASAVASRGDRGWRVGLIYGANTLGAVAGALIAGFWLIGNLGLRWTTWSAAGLNLVVAGAAWMLRTSATPAPQSETRREEEPAPSPEQNLALWAAGIAGFVSLGYEVLWTRMFSVLFASVNYSFTLILAVFLLGMAIAAPIFGKLADRIRARVEFVGLLQLLVAVCGLATFMAFTWVHTTKGTTSLAFGGAKWGEYLRSLGLDAARVMLLPAFVMGGILPAATRILAQGPEAGLASRLGRIYAASTVGAMAGSLVTGFILIPFLGNFSAVSFTLAGLAAASGAVLIFRGARWSPVNRWTVVTAAAAALVLVGYNAPRAREFLFDSAMKRTVTRLWYEEGPSLTVAVVEEPVARDRTMYTDAFQVAGTGPTYEYMRMLAHLPMILRPDAKSACVVGLGTGTTAGTLALWPLERIDIIELCPEVATGTRFFEKANNNLMARIDKEARLRLVFDDGKAYLKSTRKSYDVIVAEPLNPHMSGAASLYCREFYEAALARLNPGGVCTQWIPIHGVKTEDFRALFRTFSEVFPESAAWYFKEAIILTGHKGTFEVDWLALKDTLDRPQVMAELLSLDLGDMHTLLASFVCGPSALKNYARYADLITEDLPTIEFFRPGRPVAFAERDNLDGLTQHREQILEYIRFPDRIMVSGSDVVVATRQLFATAASGHFRARGEMIQSRLMEIDADRAGAAGDLRSRSQLFSGAWEKLKSASQLAPSDGYIKAALARYERANAPKEPDVITPEMIQAVPRMVKGTSAQKITALRWLKILRDPESMGIVHELLSDRDVNVRIAAVEALGPIGRAEVDGQDNRLDSQAALMLENVLKRGREEKDVLLQVVDSLKQIGGKGAAALTSVFPTKNGGGCADHEVRVAAVVALREIGTPESIGYLCFALDDSFVGVRGEAVVGMANARDPALIPALLDALKDNDLAVRVAAAHGLKILTGVGKTWDDKAEAEVRVACAKEWEEWWDEFRRQKDMAGRYGKLTFEGLAGHLRVLFVPRPADERAMYDEFVERLRKFIDPVKTVEVTRQALSWPGLPALLDSVTADPELWLGLVILEQKAAYTRNITPPDHPKR